MKEIIIEKIELNKKISAGDITEEVNVSRKIAFTLMKNMM